MGNPGWSTRSDTLGNILGHAHDRYTEHYLQAPAHGDAAYGYHTVAISYQIDNTFLPRDAMLALYLFVRHKPAMYRND